MSGIDWPGLLKWSMQYCDGTSDCPRRSPEDIEFLKAAIQHAMKNYKDPVQLVIECVPKLKSDAPEEVQAALSIVDTLVDDPNVCFNLEKGGVLEALVGLADHAQEPVRNVTNQILSFGLANNPQIQKLALQSGLLPKLLSVFHKDSSLESRLKAIGALAALVRHNEQAEEALVLDDKGLTLLSEALRSTELKLATKGATLVRHLLEEQRFPVQAVAAPAFLESVYTALASDHHGKNYRPRSFRSTSLARTFRVYISDIQLGEIAASLALALVKGKYLEALKSTLVMGKSALDRLVEIIKTKLRILTKKLAEEPVEQQQEQSPYAVEFGLLKQTLYECLVATRSADPVTTNENPY